MKYINENFYIILVLVYFLILSKVLQSNNTELASLMILVISFIFVNIKIYKSFNEFENIPDLSFTILVIAFLLSLFEQYFVKYLWVLLILIYTLGRNVEYLANKNNAE